MYKKSVWMWLVDNVVNYESFAENPGQKQRHIVTGFVVFIADFCSPLIFTFL